MSKTPRTDQNAEYVLDKQRLDWLESTRSEIDTDGPGFVIYNADQPLGMGISRGAHKTIREAIDAARMA